MDFLASSASQMSVTALEAPLINFDYFKIRVRGFCFQRVHERRVRVRAKVARLECFHAFALADPTALPILERSAAGEVNEILIHFLDAQTGRQ